MGRAIRTLFVLAFLAVFVAVAWVAVRGAQARGHLEEAADGVTLLQRQLRQSQVDQAHQTLDGIQSDTAQARELTSDRVWRVVAQFPWGGQNLEAVGTATAAVDDLANTGLPALVDAADGVVTFRDQLGKGQLDAAALRQVVDKVAVLDTSLKATRGELDGIDRSYLIPAVDRAVDELRSSLDVAEQVGDGLTDQAQARGG